MAQHGQPLGPHYLDAEAGAGWAGVPGHAVRGAWQCQQAESPVNLHASVADTGTNDRGLRGRGSGWSALSLVGGEMATPSPM